MASPSDTTTNVAVLARLRPLDPNDRETPCLSLGDGEGAATVVFASAAGAGGNGGNGASSTLTFGFEHVHGPESTQEAVFQHCSPIVEGVLNGVNGTIMAYGQTGSGKTHTLMGDIEGEGDEAGAGVVPRACRLLVKRLAAAEASASATEAGGGASSLHPPPPLITMTVVEIYAERVRCLLGGGKNLQLKQEPGGGGGSNGGVRAEGAVEVSVPSAVAAAAAEEDNESKDGAAAAERPQHQGLRLLQRALIRALQQRAVAATNMNVASSRSHCVVTLRVPRTGAKLCLVDLAGSERASRTGVGGAALAEGAAINKSLSVLAGVVSALAGGGGGEEGAAPEQQQHVPYRDSKLTRLLQDSLGGGVKGGGSSAAGCRTALLVCCSASRRDGAETLSSLRFASRARGVKCMVASSAAAAAPGTAAGGAAMAAMAAELERLRARLRELGGGGGGAVRGASEPSSPKRLQLLLPWLLRCASAAVLGAYLAWEGGLAV